MKAKVLTHVLAGLVLIRMTGLAQDTTAPSGGQSAPAAGAAGDPNAIIPLIAIDDLPLTDAIKNLARQAGLNYMIDPKVGFGVPGPDGKITPQPNVSLRWEKVTAQQALEALLSNYNLQLVEDPKTRIARVTIKDPAAPEPLFTKIIQLKYTGPSNVLAAVQATLITEASGKQRGKVIADIRTSQLVVVATEKEQTAVQELIARLDLPTKQVLIEAKILETTVNPKTVKGIDWSSTLSSQKISFGNGITTGETKTTLPGTPTTVTLPGGRTITTASESSSQTILNTVLGSGGVSLDTLKGFSPQTAFLNADGLNIALSFLNSSADTRVISEPRMVTLDNQKATIDVGLMYPIVNVSAGTANTTGGSQTSYSNLTVNLDVTPRITADNFIEMKVHPSILRLGPSFKSTTAGVQNDVPSFFKRTLETTVLIPGGNTLVMGGLISDEATSANAKVPLLGDLPVLGLAFRKDTKERNRQNLLIFITPTVLKDGDFRPSKTTFPQSTGAEPMEEGWSAWDSGKPKDWSNPYAVPLHDANYMKAGARKIESDTGPSAR